MTFIGMGVGPLIIGGLSDALTPTFGGAAVRYALVIGNVSVALGAICFLLAARTLRADLAYAREGSHFKAEQGEP